LCNPGESVIKQDGFIHTGSQNESHELFSNKFQYSTNGECKVSCRLISNVIPTLTPDLFSAKCDLENNEVFNRTQF